MSKRICPVISKEIKAICGLSTRDIINYQGNT